MQRTMQVVIVLLGLTAVAAVATALTRRGQRPTATEQALGRGLQPGMSLNEATALLRRLEVPFTVDSSAEGTAIVKYGRQEARDSRISSVTEQQLVFDRQGRLREMLTSAQVSGP
jgi:hypothetical protein